MAADDTGETWDLSENDRAALKALTARLQVLTQENDRLDGDVQKWHDAAKQREYLFCPACGHEEFERDELAEALDAAIDVKEEAEADLEAAEQAQARLTAERDGEIRAIRDLLARVQELGAAVDQMLANQNALSPRLLAAEARVQELERERDDYKQSAKANRANYEHATRMKGELEREVARLTTEKEKIRKVADAFDLPSPKDDVVERVRDMGLALAKAWCERGLEQANGERSDEGTRP